jgi:hypothetical protein
MAVRPFPAEPWRRKGIVILEQHDVERCHYEEDGNALLLDEEIYVLEFPIQDSNPATQNLVDSGLVRPGTVLVQSPFDKDVYEDVAEATQRFALAKHMYFSTFCMYLGAREVTIEQIELRRVSGKTTLNLKGGIPALSGDLSAKSEEIDAFRSQLTLRDSFTGGQADLQAAEELLRRRGLFGDANLRTLLDMRRASSPNQIVSRTITLNLSNEVKRNLGVIGRLKIAKFIKLEADFGRAVREQSEYTVTVQVIF